jgi:hypothetical protein
MTGIPSVTTPVESGGSARIGDRQVKAGVVPIIA